MLKPIFLQSGIKSAPFSTEQMLAEIHSTRLDLSGRQAYKPQSGLSSHTVIIDDEVFKGLALKGGSLRKILLENSPKRAEKISEFIIEAQILLAVESRDFSLNIPQVTTMDRGHKWFGISLLDGKEMRRAFNDLPMEIRGPKYNDAANAFGLFMAELQESIPWSQTRQAWVAKNSLHDSVKVKNVLDRPGMRQIIGPAFDTCCEAADNLDKFKLILTHGDLQPSNVMVDKITGDVTGIIDFGYSRFRLPQAELSKLRKAYSSDFVDRVRLAYSGKQDQEIETRDIALWDIADQVMRLSKSMDAHNSHAVNHALENINKLMPL